MSTRLLLLFLFNIATITANAQGGETGPLSWNISGGTLTISGSGAMPNYGYTDAPWYPYRASITNIVIGNEVTNIGNNAFPYCDLTSISIPNSVNSIGSYAFSHCNRLNTVILEDGPSTLSANIVYNSFNDCPISILHLGRNLSTSSTSLFKNKTTLTTLTIGAEVTSIWNDAFSGCSNLTNFIIPNSIFSIGNEAFRGCAMLTNIIIPSSVTSIGNSTFYGCDLTSISIPNSINSIGSYAFGNCSRLSSVILEDGTTTLSVNLVYNSFNNCPINNLYLGRNLSAASLFEKKTTLATLTIGEEVTSIGNNAFKDCTGLTNVIIGSSVTTLGNSAFQGCSNLTNIIIPNSVTSLGTNTFSGCGLTTIYAKRATPPTAGNNCFYNVYNTCTLYVPVGSVDAYKAANEWKKFFTILEEGVGIIPIKNDNISVQTFSNAIVIEAKEQTDVSIYNLMGQKVYQSVINGNAEIHLNKGIYIVRMNNESTKIIVP
jgi:hypothetical protein